MWPAGGDVEGKLALLKRDLAEIRYPGVFDDEGARRGRPNALLPVITFVLHRYSRHVAAAAAEAALVGRRGRRYVEGVFKLARDTFDLRIGMNSAQFLAEGYAERKLMLTHQLIAAVRSYTSTAVRKARLGELETAHASTAPCPQPQASKTRVGRSSDSEPKGGAVAAAAPDPAPHSSPTASYVAQINVIDTPEDQPRPLPPVALGATASPAAAVPSFAAFISPLLRFGLAEEGSPGATPCTSAPVSPAPAVSAMEWVPPPAAPRPPPPPSCSIPVQLVHEVRGLQGRLERLADRVQGASERVAAVHTSLGAHVRVVEGRVLALEAALLRARGQPMVDYSLLNPLNAQHQSPQVGEGHASPPGTAGSGGSSRVTPVNAGGGLSPGHAKERLVSESCHETPPGSAQAVLRSLRARVVEAQAALEEARGALGQPSL